MLNVFVPTIFCILWHIFMLNVANYDFSFLFSCINLWGIFPGPIESVAKGRGRLTLCGPNGGTLTQVEGMMNWVIMSGRGVLYLDEGERPHNQNQGFPLLYLKKQSFGHAKESVLKTF